jgi:hypothetical protein
VDHRKYLEAAKGYCGALRAYRAATSDGDAETISEAAEKFAKASVLLNALTSELSRNVRGAWMDPRRRTADSSD